tara:strand:- start:87216 stop:87677 length:462 start_codon:yes stop_codon:yes gene_type:complete
MEISLMFFKKTRTKRLIKNRYTKSRKRNSTNRQLEVWDAQMLEWVFLVSILDQFPDQYFAEEYFEWKASTVMDTFANEGADSPVVRNQSENIADEWLEREPIKEPTEVSSFESDSLIRPSVSGEYSPSNDTSSSDTGYSFSGYSSSSSCGGFD